MFYSMNSPMPKAPKKNPPPHSIHRLSTEQNISEKAPLDALDALAVVRQIHAQDAVVADAVSKELPQIAKAVDAAAQALRRGGRIFYVGAGTSGRLGVLDSAECPPTFGIAPEKIQAVIAGGHRALLHAAEAAEDNAEQGARDLAARRVGPRDLVIGLSASGRTPYTVGALRYARSRRCTTVAIACNPGSPLERVAHIGIISLTGAEILSGSTRMKAGLAQKMVLQMISTAAMAQRRPRVPCVTSMPGGRRGWSAGCVRFPAQREIRWGS